MNPAIVMTSIMAISIIIAMSYRVTDNIIHEVNGIVIITLFALHNVINRKWYKSIGKGRYDIYRVLCTTVNILIVLMILILIINGVLLPRTIVPFIDAGESMLPKRMHTFAAYWLFILISIHMGLYWRKVYNSLKLRLNRAILIFIRLSAFLVAVCGIYASLSRQVGARLIMYHSFDFHDPSEPAIYFILSNFVIMWLYAFSAYYLSRLPIKARKTAKEKTDVIPNHAIYNTIRSKLWMKN